MISRRHIRALALLPAAALVVGAAPPAPAGTLSVGFDALRSAKGVVRLCLTRDPKRFPDCKGDPHAVTDTVPAAAAHRTFRHLSVGTWAISVLHDENGNARLDTMAGIPREGVGFSRNPKLGMSAPKFGAAAFAVEDGAETRQQIRMRYFL